MIKTSRDVNDKTRRDMTDITEKYRDNQVKIGVLLAGVICISVILGISVSTMLADYREKLLKEQTKQMEYLVQSVTNSIEVYVNEFCEDLDMLAADPYFLDTEEQYLEFASRKLKEYMEQVCRLQSGSLGFLEYVNPNGDSFTVPEMQRYEVILPMTEPGAETKIDLVRTGEKEFFLRFQQSTEKAGKLSSFLDLRGLYQDTASYITLGNNGYVMLKASDGRILTHPSEEQIGIDVIEGRQEMHPDLDLTELKTMVEDQLAGNTGIAVYDSYWWTEDPPPRVRKISSYQPAHIGNDFLVVSAVIDYNELSDPIQHGAIRILAVAGILCLVLVLLAVFLIRMLRQQRQYETENAHLRQVNARLEELRKQEEIMAHQQRLQLVGTMTGGIAHEFNNLLTPIMGYSALLLDETDPADEKYQDLKEIYDSAEKAKEIIDQITQFAGKNAEKTFRWVEIHPIVQRALVIVQSIVPRKIRLELSLSEHDCMIYGNSTQIHQVILNLCSNALHAMKEQEHGVLRLTSDVVYPESKDEPFFRGKESQLFYRLTVEDNGCGMSPETLSQIYVPFFTTKKAGEGTGLGLAVVNRIVESHKGLLTVKSEPGSGTCFTLYLPAEKEAGT